MVIKQNLTAADKTSNMYRLSEEKKLHGPFLWMGFNYLKPSVTSRRQYTFYHKVPRYSWYSFYQPRKDERLSQPSSHPVVLNTGPLDSNLYSNFFQNAITSKYKKTDQCTATNINKDGIKHKREANV